jgi:hypothetical protein
MKRAAILLSRQPRRPCARDAWVQQTITAVDHLANLDATIVSSVGLQTWELIAAAAAMRQTRICIVIPTTSDEEFEQEAGRIRTQFALTDELVKFEAEAQVRRDAAVIERADILLPISIRADGNMVHAVRDAEQAGREIIRDFQIPYVPRQERMAYDIRPDLVSPQIDNIDREYLIHWTRASNGPWPDERMLDFYRDVMTAGHYPRTACDTLCRILRMRRLVGSPRHMPAKTPVVSFTGLCARACIPLMKWRARYGEMSFEPYGIAILRSWADKIGIQPVIYHDNPGRPPSGVEVWRTQSRGARTDWRQEDEHRCRGDLNLSEVPSDQMMAFCLTPAESSRIEKECGIRAVSFY